MKNEMEEGEMEAVDPFDSIKRWFKLLAAGMAVALCSVLLTSVALVRYQSQNEAEREEQFLEERTDRAVESCKLYNEDQLRDRDFAHDQLVTIFAVFSRSDHTVAQVEEEREEELAAYDSFVASKFPFRQCTPQCVEALVEPEMKKCPPAKTVEG